jgi:hypothetical protein
MKAPAHAASELTNSPNGRAPPRRMNLQTAAAFRCRPTFGMRGGLRVANELHQLHEGNIAHHGLRLSEFRAWKDRQSNPHYPSPPATLKTATAPHGCTDC